MTKSEKSVLEDIAGMLNAILTGNSDGNQPAHEEADPADDTPSQYEIKFVKNLKGDEKIAIRGVAIKLETGEFAEIKISSRCLSHLLDAYLEKYDHE